MTTRIAVFSLVLAGLFWIDPLFVPLVLFGPIVTGIVAARRNAVRPAAIAWFIAGLLALASDWIINNEDQAFHLVMALYTAAVTLAVGVLVRRLARRSGDVLEAVPGRVDGGLRPVFDAELVEDR